MKKLNKAAQRALALIDLDIRSFEQSKANERTKRESNQDILDDIDYRESLNAHETIFDLRHSFD